MSVLINLVSERERNADHYRTIITKNSPLPTVAQCLSMIVVGIIIYRYYDKILSVLGL